MDAVSRTIDAAAKAPSEPLAPTSPRLRGEVGFRAECKRSEGIRVRGHRSDSACGIVPSPDLLRVANAPLASRPLPASGEVAQAAPAVRQFSAGSLSRGRFVQGHTFGCPNKIEAVDAVNVQVLLLGDPRARIKIWFAQCGYLNCLDMEHEDKSPMAGQLKRTQI